jgi:hypothetical protein
MSFGRWVVGVALGAAMIVACGDESRFFIVQNQVPEVAAGICSIPVGKSDHYSGEGVLDAALVGAATASAYDLYPLVQNDLPRAGAAGAVEANRLFVKGFRVRLELDPAAPVAARQVFDGLAADEGARGNLAFDEPWAATLDPGGSMLSASVRVVGGEVARRLVSAKVFETVPTVRLFARVRALGARELGDLETPEFRFPITVCFGCLISHLGSCPVSARTHEGNACNLSQDRSVDCCAGGNGLVCPAPLMVPAPPPATKL